MCSYYRGKNHVCGVLSICLRCWNINFEFRMIKFEEFKSYETHLPKSCPQHVPSQTRTSTNCWKTNFMNRDFKFIHSFILETYIAPLQETTTQRRSQPSHGQKRRT